MIDDILLITTPASFGELIRQTLQETERFRVVLAGSGREAIQDVPKKPYVLGILDTEVKDTPVAELINYFKATYSGMRFIVIPPNNHPDDPEVVNLPIDDFLMKPFYLPDLLETVDRVLSLDKDQTVNRIQTEDWVLEESIAEKPIRQSEKVTEEKISLTSKYGLMPAWLLDEVRTSQFLTSISLESDAQGILMVKGDQLWAYAGQISQPAVQEIARVIANYWSGSPGNYRGKKSDLTRFVRLGSTGGEYMLFATPLCNEMVLGLVFEAETPFNQVRSQAYKLAHTLASLDGIRQERGGSKTKEVTLTKPLLDNIPPPMPGLMSSKQPDPKEIGRNFVQALEPDQPAFTDMTEIKPKLIETIIPEPRQQSALPVVFDLSYFCLLVPRMPQHQLNGDLATKLSEWVGQLCMAYGWRLEHFSIHADFMQWVVNVIPTVAPDSLVETLRKQTSERIFASFPELSKDNPSGDFWAPGYLILTRIEQLSDQMIEDFICQVRNYQGASYSNRMRR